MTVDLIERVAKHVALNEAGCLIWTGGTADGGYGKITIGSRTDGSRRTVIAHRLVYELTIGPIPPGLDLDHLCRNRLCCRPEHLEPVSRSENVKRGAAGVLRKPPTHCPRGHAYSGENLRIARNGSPVCRTCHRDQERARYRTSLNTEPRHRRGSSASQEDA